MNTLTTTARDALVALNVEATDANVADLVTLADSASVDDLDSLKELASEHWLVDRVYGDWEWNETTQRPDNIYPARIYSWWGGGCEFLTDRATAERIVNAQTALRADALYPDDMDALAFDGDTLVLTNIEGTVYRFDPTDTEGLYPCGFGWTWSQWTDDDEQNWEDAR
jgi:hypothetical protein